MLTTLVGHWHISCIKWDGRVAEVSACHMPVGCPFRIPENIGGEYHCLCYFVCLSNFDYHRFPMLFRSVSQLKWCLPFARPFLPSRQWRWDGSSRNGRCPRLPTSSRRASKNLGNIMSMHSLSQRTLYQWVCISALCFIFHALISFQAINLRMEFEWIRLHDPEHLHDVKVLFLRKVCCFLHNLITSLCLIYFA